MAFVPANSIFPMTVRRQITEQNEFLRLAELRIRFLRNEPDFLGLPDGVEYRTERISVSPRVRRLAFTNRASFCRPWPARAKLRNRTNS